MEEATIEDSESQILEALERESVDSTSVIWPRKADSEMKDGKIREASCKREAIWCGSGVRGGVTASLINGDDNFDFDLDCFLVLLLLLLLICFELEEGMFIHTQFCFVIEVT